MKIIVFFVAMLSTFFTMHSYLFESLKVFIASDDYDYDEVDFLKAITWGVISIITWTIFYYLTQN